MAAEPQSSPCDEFRSWSGPYCSRCGAFAEAHNRPPAVEPEAQAEGRRVPTTKRREGCDHSSGVDIAEGHALDLIAECPPLDLICSDPPYAFGGSGGEHAISATVATALREAAHKLKRGHWAVVFAASSWRSTSYMIEATRGLLEPVRFGTWVKPVARTKVKTPGWAWASVTVIVLRKGPKTAVGEPSELVDHIEAPPLMVGRRAELPPAVARWAVEPFAVPGGTMLDPFSGSGALCKAAADCGMHALGYEMAP